MSYELTRIENSKYPCPRCGGRTIKLGTVHNYSLGTQYRRRRCEDCGKSYNAEKQYKEMN